MAENNIPEIEKELVISFYEAQEKLRDIFNDMAIVDEATTATDFVLAYSDMVSEKFDCHDSQREELNEYVKSIVSSLVEGTIRRTEAGESKTQIEFYNDFLIGSFPQYMKDAARRLNYISEAALAYTPQKPEAFN